MEVNKSRLEILMACPENNIKLIENEFKQLEKTNVSLRD
jgi:hypothetical protein